MAVQLVVEAAVGPGDPHQREQHGELAKPAPCQVPGQVVGGLGDQHHHGEVVEELERADCAFARLLTVRAGRLPQRIAQPGPPLPAAGLTPRTSAHSTEAAIARAQARASVWVVSTCRS